MYADDARTARLSGGLDNKGRVAPSIYRALTGRIFLTRAFAALVLSMLLVSSEGWRAKHVLVEESLYMAGVALVALCLIGRVWSLSYIAGNKDRRLTTKGPYSICRNPLYFSNFLGAAGLGFCTETFTVPMLVAAVFALYYPSVIRKEEQRLQKAFGAEFEDYVRRVPRFFPSLRAFVEDEDRVISERPFRKGLMDLAAIVLVMGFIEFMEALHEAKVLATYFTLY